MRLRVAHALLLLGVLGIVFLYLWGAELAKERDALHSSMHQDRHELCIRIV
jgi:hypothetical protein